MNSPAHGFDRRQFLAAGAAGLLASGLHAAPAVSAAEPADSKRPSKMKLSLAAYSFNRMLPRNGTPEQIEKAEMTLESFVDYCASLNLDGTELTGYYFPKFVADAESVEAEPVRDYINALKNQCFRLGLDVSGTAIGNDFALPEGSARQAQLAMTRHWIDVAAELGAPVIRIFAGRTPKGDSDEAAIERCAAGINESLEYAAKKGVFLALENHGGITATPEQMLRIIEQVNDSPWFGVNFDSGNFRTDDPYRDLAKIAPLAINAQLKVAVTQNGQKQKADFARIIGILKDAGYRGYIVLEYEERDPKENIPKYIDELRNLIG